MLFKEALKVPPPAKHRRLKGVHFSGSFGHSWDYRSCCGYDNAVTDK